jgi:non-ribosomal peptide synthetase component F
VAKGYLHRPDLTAEKFLSNPIGSGVVYRTGDIVKQLDGGEYVFVRRMDDQVKIDGFRIELAEIEAVYNQHDAVEQAVRSLLCVTTRSPST